jgi:hypothetical protein
MDTQCLLQDGKITVLVIGSSDDELSTVVSAAHAEHKWLQERTHAKVFADYR